MTRTILLALLALPLLANAEDSCDSNTAAGLLADLDAITPPERVTITPTVGTVDTAFSTAADVSLYQDKRVDRDFGRGTMRAVQAFQRDNNLKDDGVVGQKTWDALLGR